MCLRLFPACFSLLCLLLSTTVSARELTIQVSNQQGEPLNDAVVELVTGEPAEPPAKRNYVMDQVDKAFVPEVLVVPTGASVAFPNSDDIRHHVYSFSRAKPFELKLYAGQPEAPVRFDNPGIVVLGCNIHDSMVGYIYVTRSAHTGVTGEDGLVTFTDLPEGLKRATVWHPHQSRELEQRRQLEFSDGSGARQIVTVVTEPPGPRNTFEDVFRDGD